MKKNTDITSIDYYLQNMDSLLTKSVHVANAKKQKNFKILVKDDVKDSVYLIDA